MSQMSDREFVEAVLEYGTPQEKARVIAKLTPGGRNDPYTGDASRDAAILGGTLSMLPAGRVAKGAGFLGKKAVGMAKSPAVRSAAGGMALDAIPFGNTAAKLAMVLARRAAQGGRSSAPSMQRSGISYGRSRGGRRTRGIGR